MPKVFLQTLNMTNRWKKTSEDVQAISAPKDISSFLSCITIPGENKKKLVKIKIKTSLFQVKIKKN